MRPDHNARSAPPNIPPSSASNANRGCATDFARAIQGRHIIAVAREHQSQARAENRRQHERGRHELQRFDSGSTPRRLISLSRRNGARSLVRIEARARDHTSSWHETTIDAVSFRSCFTDYFFGPLFVSCSSRILNSTRRFAWRPGSVSFESIGFSCPKPCASSRSFPTPCCVSHAITEFARF
jgi:hypothetical protein